MSITSAGPVHFTVEQAAAFLSVSTATIRRRIAAGEIEAVQLGPPGSAVRVPLAGLTTYLDAHGFPREAA